MLGSVVSDTLRPRGLWPPSSFVYGILQARILQWGAISFSRGSSQSGVEPASLVPLVLAGGFFTTSATFVTSNTKAYVKGEEGILIIIPVAAFNFFQAEIFLECD